MAVCAQLDAFAVQRREQRTGRLGEVSEVAVDSAGGIPEDLHRADRVDLADVLHVDGEHGASFCAMMWNQKGAEESPLRPEDVWATM